jgi:hypothetical protein
MNWYDDLPPDLRRKKQALKERNRGKQTKYRLKDLS